MKPIGFLKAAFPALLAVGLAVPAMASPATQPTAPTTQPSALAAPSTQPSEDVAALIRQLGDDDFRTRLDAADKLRAIGKPALPALAEARQSSNLEIQVRARDLMQDIEHPASPPQRVPQASGENGSHSIAISRTNGTMVVVAKDPGRTTHVEEDSKGIHMTVTGQLDGQEVTREFNAENAEALKKTNPEAFALYQESTGLLHNGHGMLGANGGMFQQIHVQAGPMVGGHIEIHTDIRGDNIVLEKLLKNQPVPVPPVPTTQP